MLKYVLTTCFLLTLFGLLQHPVPILENVEVYSEGSDFNRNDSRSILKETEEHYFPQAKIELIPTDNESYQSFLGSQTAHLRH